MGSAPIDTWQEMEAKLQEKYMHTNYNDKLCDQFINLRQNNMLVAKYMNKFDELKTRSRIIEDPQQILTRFKVGLRPKIKRELLRQPLYNLEHTIRVTLDIEEYVGYSINRKLGVMTMESTHKKLHDTNRSMRPRSPHLFNPPTGSKPSSSQMVDPKSKGIK